jgi:DNA-binding transcriptional MocR family regulator
MLCSLPAKARHEESQFQNGYCHAPPETAKIGAMDTIGITLDRTNTTPLFRQIEGVLAAAIASGELHAGTRLPSEREMAEHLGVSRTTAMNAYRELESRGLVRGQVGRGTFVSASGHQERDAPFAWQGKVALGAQRTLDPTMRGLVRAETPDTISFAAGSPALDRFPVEHFRDLVSRAMVQETSAAIGLGPTEGQPRLRAELARRAGVRPEQVLVVTGSQQGLDLIARCLLDPGDTVIMDRPGYLGAIQTFRAAGVHVIGWDIARADPEELEDLLQRYRPKLLYTNPTYHNPTGRTVPLAVRQELLTLAARYRLPVIEDEPYRELGFGSAPPPTLLELDEHGLVIHLGTFSKTLAAGLRLGWLVAPEAVIDQLALVKQRCDLFGAGAFQLAVAEMLARGSYDAHLHALRAEHARRYAAMVMALERRLPRHTFSWAPVDGGLYLWVHAGPGADTRYLAQRALDAGVGVVSGEPFYPEGAGWHELRLCFARNPPEAIVRGVDRLAQVLTMKSEPGMRSGATLPLM